MGEEKSKVMRISNEAYATLTELSDRTRIPMVSLVDEIFESVQKQLDLMQINRKLLFMCDLYTRDRMPKVIIRLSDANSFGFLGNLDVPNDVKRELQKRTDQEDGKQ